MSPESSPATNVFDAAKAIVESLKGLDNEHQEQAIRFASESLGLRASSRSQPPAGTGHSPPATPTPPLPAETHERATDIKQFTEAKAPRTDTQFAAIAAYYYQFEAPEDQRKDTIGPEDLQEAARLASRRRPGNAGQTLRNARNAGYLDNAESGRFRLSTVGENLVAVTLPGDASSTGSNQKKTTRKKRGKRGTKKSQAKKKAGSKKKRTSRGQ